MPPRRPTNDPLTSLDANALKTALEASDTLMNFKAVMPPTGLMLMLVSKFRDDTRDALGMEPERYHGRGEVFKSLDALTSTELDKVAGAVGILLQDRFTRVMDDPALPRLLEGFQAELEQQKAERAEIQASIAS